MLLNSTSTVTTRAAGTRASATTAGARRSSAFASLHSSSMRDVVSRTSRSKKVSTSSTSTQPRSWKAATSAQHPAVAGPHSSSKEYAFWHVVDVSATERSIRHPRRSKAKNTGRSSLIWGHPAVKTAQ